MEVTCTPPVCRGTDTDCGLGTIHAVHCDYHHPHTPTNAHNLYKSTYPLCTWTEIRMDDMWFYMNCVPFLCMWMILTEEFLVDLCSGLSWGNRQSLICDQSPTFSVKNTLRWSAVVFCACAIIQFFSVVFRVVRAMHKFDSRLVINETPNKWRPVERRSCNNRDSCFWQAVYVFPRDSSQC
jgi:hypothetical protein